ncbi:21146_t:CDS:2, partial [Racocetra persica]
PEDISPNIDTTKNNICMICKGAINPSIKEAVTILNCKHFYHKDCIREKYLLYQETTNEYVIISTSLTDYTKPTMFTEPIEPLMLTKSIKPIINIESIKSTESNKSTNSILVEFIELSTSFILAESTKSITSFLLAESTKPNVSVKPTASASASIVSIESGEISISTT